ncbi:MAG: hypothetical protein AB7T49_00025 [Oligoflexales bacterium]
MLITQLLSAFLLLSAIGCARPPEMPEPEAKLLEDEDIAAEEDPVDDVTSVPAAEKEEEEIPVDEIDVPLLPPSPIVLDAAKIAELCVTSPKMTRTESITFPSIQTMCDWRNNGNGPGRDFYQHARREEQATVPLNVDEIVCDVTVTAAEETTHNDDLFFVMDKYVLAGDVANTVATFDKVGALPMWSFAKVFNTRTIEPRQKTNYCIGGPDTCVIDQFGAPFQVNAMAAQIAPLSVELLEKAEVNFTLVITGDNHSNDCVHSDFPLSIQISTIANPNIP